MRQVTGFFSIRRRLAAAAVLGACLALTAPALAAPQLLGLVADNRGIGVQCLRGDCFAEFTAFCLQPERQSPAPGTRYRALDPGDIEVIGTTRDGRRVLVDPAELDIAAARTHVAVRIGMTARRMHDLGIRDVRIRIGANVTLRPEPWAGDKNPITDAEAELVGQSLRKLGSNIVDRNGRDMVAARVANRMINALPPGGRVDQATRGGLWRAAVVESDFAGAEAGGRELAREVFERCLDKVDRGSQFSMRRCLEGQHDSHVGTLNNRYWKAVRTGS